MFEDMNFKVGENLPVELTDTNSDKKIMVYGT